MNVTSNNYSPGFCFTHIFTKSDRDEHKIREKVNFKSVYQAFRVIKKSYHTVTFSRFRGFAIFLSAKGTVFQDFYFSFVSWFSFFWALDNPVSIFCLHLTLNIWWIKSFGVDSYTMECLGKLWKNFCTSCFRMYHRCRWHRWSIWIGWFVKKP